jgi:low affinity Fe/Cu permease
MLSGDWADLRVIDHAPSAVSQEIAMPAKHPIRAKFRVFSETVAELAGSPIAFAVAVGLFLLWVVTGPIFNWSEGHHRLLDVTLAIIPFWMVFVLQATQNRDSDIVAAKLDELLKAVEDAREDLVGIQHKPEEEVDGIR